MENTKKNKICTKGGTPSNLYKFIIQIKYLIISNKSE